MFWLAHGSARVVAMLTFVAVAAGAFIVLMPSAASEAMAKTSLEDTQATAESEPCSIDVEAINGSVSDFFGKVTRHADDLWYVELPDARVIARAEGNTLRGHFDDDRPDTIIEFDKGTPADLMDAIESDSSCGGCTDMTGCINHCGSDSDLRFCWCTANVTCESGIKLLGWSDGACCFTCN